MIAGKIVACKWVKLACQRFIDDFERAKSPKFPYKYVDEKAERAVKFIEALPHTKGRWAGRGELLKLQPFQVFKTCNLFGWVEKSNPGRYRFRKAYVEEPRKNGKSPWAAGVALYKFCADREHGAEVYCGATTERQAWEVFRPARLMALNTPALQQAFDVTVGAKALAILRNGSRFEPLIGLPGDGAAPSCFIKDEYHEDADDLQVEAMETGMVGRENPLELFITTAGFDQAGPCYNMHLDAQKILERTIIHERLFTIIFTVDEGDDWTTEAALIKANPNYGISVDPEIIRDDLHNAIRTARKQNAFKTKHLNIWCNAASSWMNMALWDKCADRTLQLDDFLNEECVASFDLASKRDTATKLLVFRRDLPTPAAKGAVLPHYFVFTNCYLNEERVTAPGNEHYAGWATDGHLISTPGSVTDYNWIAESLVDDTKRYLVREVPHDPYHAAALVQFLQAREDWNQSVQFVEIRQSVQNMSPAMKETEALVTQERLHHDGNPALTWMISNVICRADKKDNIFPLKQRPENKIDGGVSLFMAISSWTRLELAGPPPKSIFENGPIVL